MADGFNDIAGTFDAAERKRIAGEWERLSAEPAPPDRRGVGCALVVLAVAVAAIGPWLLKTLGFSLPGTAKAVAATALLLLFLVGAFMSLVLASSLYSRYRARAEEALAWLGSHADGDVPTRRRMAVAALFYAYCSDGPSTTNTFDFAGAKARLGAALPYVMAVEQVLVAEKGIYRVFTDDKIKLPG